MCCFQVFPGQVTCACWQRAPELSLKATADHGSVGAEDNRQVAGGGVEVILRGVPAGAQLPQQAGMNRGTIVHGDVVTVTAVLQPV